MRRLLYATAALCALACGCRSSEAAIEIGFGDDAGTCAGITDLSCVNYLQFSIDDGTGFTTQCVKVTQVLTSLCDVASLADGRELFRVDPDREVKIKVEGLRVYPATSCNVNAENPCQRRLMFSGETPRVRIGDLAGQSIPLVVTVSELCRGQEQFFPLGSGETCEMVCGGEKVVCAIQDGCLCKTF